MATFKAVAKTFGLKEWTETGSILKKATTEAEGAPSEATLIKTEGSGKKQTITEWEGLPASFKKITALAVHVYAKSSSGEGKDVKVAVLNAAKEAKLTSELTLKTTSAWFKAEMVKATAEALSKTDVEKLAVELEGIKVSIKDSVYEVYLSGEYEEEAVVRTAAGTTPVKFPTSAVASAVVAAVAKTAFTLGPIYPITGGGFTLSFLVADAAGGSAKVRIVDAAPAALVVQPTGKSLLRVASAASTAQTTSTGSSARVSFTTSAAAFTASSESRTAQGSARVTFGQSSGQAAIGVAPSSTSVALGGTAEASAHSGTAETGASTTLILTARAQTVAVTEEEEKPTPPPVIRPPVGGSGPAGNLSRHVLKYPPEEEPEEPEEVVERVGARTALGISAWADSDMVEQVDLIEEEFLLLV